MPDQHTLQHIVEVDGIGLHTGQSVSARLCPAPVDHGVGFTRADLGGQLVVPARLQHVVQTRLATSLEHQGHRITTVEHLMAALLGEGVDNVLVQVDGPELPALDGSAAQWVTLIHSAGLASQDGVRRAIRVLHPVEVHIEQRVARLLPAPHFQITARIQFDHPMVGEQTAQVTLDNGGFTRELAWARTFGFLHQVEALRRMGLVLGGDLDNAIVYDERSVMNPGGLHAPDEAVRHKMLDIMGDLALLGHPLLARVEAHLPGHGLTVALAQALLDQPDAWEYQPALPSLR